MLTNQALENIYDEAAKASENEALRIFFNDRKAERRSYNQDLLAEVEKFNDNTALPQKLGTEAYKLSMGFRSIIFLKDHNQIVREVCRVKQLTINKYNALLSELNLPLSLCKSLSEQRDSVMSHMNAVTRLEHLITQEA
ncbi:PA2169 family four-helix-bundle protein [Flavobacteriaceae bacterium GSB9]|nr:PA2169 family four-helix-bundle protein [Flavobacteriaceae bacterium GSB9]